jgi:hypothetical protein
MAQQFLGFSLPARQYAPRSGKAFFASFLLPSGQKGRRLAGRDPPVLKACKV